jgi:hypothetical protein
MLFAVLVMGEQGLGFSRRSNIEVCSLCGLLTGSGWNFEGGVVVPLALIWLHKACI